jgi:cell division septum initiation protein DivIVA
MCPSSIRYGDGVDFTAGDARTVRFSGSGGSYDREEVEDFRRRVIAALEEGERLSSDAAARIAGLEAALAERADTDGAGNVAAARRARDQAVQLTSRMMAEVLSGKMPSIAEGMEIWQEAVILRAMAEEELAAAREESRGLRQITAEELTALRAATRAALDEEVEATLDHAIGHAAAVTSAAEEEVRHLDRRLTQLRTALSDAESRIRSLTGDALTELRMLGDLLALETGALEEIESLKLSPDHVIDLAEPAPVPAAATDPGTVLRDEASEDGAEDGPSAFVRRIQDRDDTTGQGFYERRLAGLRERLERHNAGHLYEP